MAHWYCNKCRLKKEPPKIGFFKKCKDCGSKLVWVDVVRGFLFNKYRGDFYELTKEKPLDCINGKQFGVMEYVLYLEDRLQKCESK